jgi:hypothetical protein
LFARQEGVVLCFCLAVCVLALSLSVQETTRRRLDAGSEPWSVVASIDLSPFPISSMGVRLNTDGDLVVLKDVDVL